MDILRNVFRAAVLRFIEQGIQYGRHFLPRHSTVRGLKTSTQNAFPWRKRDQDATVQEKASSNSLSLGKAVRISHYKDSLSVDFEDIKLGDIPRDTRVQQLDEAITVLVQPSLPATVSFSHIPESMYISGIKIRMSRLGYDSYFQRYNDDHGIAVFHRKKETV